MGETLPPRAMGWLPDYPSFRDYTIEHDTVAPTQKALGQTDSVHTMLQKVHAVAPAKTLPRKTDLRAWCSPIEDQGALGSCTAHAGVGLVEYFERRAFGKHLDASRLFLYKVTRKLMHCNGDTGAFLRSTAHAMAVFGVPPEEFWPYVPADFDREPSAFCYAFAQSYQAINYYRLDPPAMPPTRAALLKQIKTSLAAGLPLMFGFSVYSSYRQADSTGKIPWPVAGEKLLGGHAVDAVGYDDTLKMKNTGPRGKETTGALLIRNSWGEAWGEAGYGWLPYEYVLQGLAVDWWSLLKQEWIDSEQFGEAA